jgi:hypothetical protein
MLYHLLHPIGAEACQEFEFPVLIVLLYVREACLCSVVELDLTTSDSSMVMLLPSLRAWFQVTLQRGTPSFETSRREIVIPVSQTSRYGPVSQTSNDETIYIMSIIPP